MEDISNFSYQIRMGLDAAFMKTGMVGYVMPNCGEIVINSKLYTDFDVCEKQMSSLLSMLSIYESTHLVKNYVIVSRINPILNADAINDVESDSWDNFTVMRAYVADAELLTDSQLLYNITAQIKSSGNLKLINTP